MSLIKLPSLALAAAAVLALGFAATGPAAAAPASIAGQHAEPRQPRSEAPRLLSDDDIELIKVYEVKLEGDGRRRPRIVIPRETLQTFLNKYREEVGMPRGRDQQREFMEADGYLQLGLMFKVRARDLYKDVRVRTPVESLKEWNQIHSRYVMGYFQPTFGAGQLENFALIPQGRDEKRIAITNFYILTQTKINGVPLIDRYSPEESLLLQWGLPRQDAKFAAPEDLEGWRPYFRGSGDERYTEYVNWIKTLIRDNQGVDYDISYKLPGQDDKQSGPQQPTRPQ